VLEKVPMLLELLESCNNMNNQRCNVAWLKRIDVFSHFDVNQILTGSGRHGEVVATYWSESGELRRYREVLCNESRSY